MSSGGPRILVLGASGLVGHGIALGLRRRGHAVAGLARRFAQGQRAALGREAREAPFVDLDTPSLRRILAESRPDIVVNAVGVLQDGPDGRTDEVHRAFVDRLLAALPTDALLIHVSMPGLPEADRTAFSRTKRAAEALIAASGRPHVVLRPGFVIGPAAYGGSALLRALALAPVALPAREAAAPFAVTALADLVETADAVARRWVSGERDLAVAWDVMERHPGTLGRVVEALPAHLGGSAPRLPLPSPLLGLSARAGDLASRLGWRPPVRSTALAELRRGVAGDPGPWAAATGIAPQGLAAALEEVPSTVQERWFARLHLLKALILPGLVLFWIVSGLIAIGPAFDAARDILLARGFPHGLSTFVTVVSSLADIVVGALIAARRTCRAGLLAGIGLSLFYMAGAAILTPDLWIEPLGALVKTGPAIILMLVALATLDDR